MKLLIIYNMLAVATINFSCSSVNKKISVIDDGVASSKNVCLRPESGKTAFLGEKHSEMLPKNFYGDKSISDKKFSFTFLDSTLREALMEIGAAAKIPIVFDGSLDGTVSVEVVKAPFFDALEMILATGNLDYKYDGKSVYVGSSDPKSADWWRLTFSVRYKTLNIIPSVAMKLLNPVFKPFVMADDSLGVVSILGTRRQVLSVLESLYDIDVAPRQVLLKMSIAEISETAFDKLGRMTGNGTLFGAANSLSPIRPAFRQAVMGSESYSSFMSSVDFMAREGWADIRAQPKIMVMDGEKAKFESKNIQNPKTSDRYNTVNKSYETGVFMSITPSIVENDGVLLNITEARAGDFDAVDESKINESLISTKVRVKGGETLLLGGMIAKKKRVVISKIPFLGDIPYLGWLFKSKSEENATVEVIFSVSPEIICEPVGGR